MEVYICGNTLIWAILIGRLRPLIYTTLMTRTDRLDRIGGAYPSIFRYLLQIVDVHKLIW